MSQTKYKTILLIDDNEIDNFTNQKLIENAHFATAIQIANSAKEGLDKLKAAVPDQLPEIIFLDIMMPVMDGFQFLDEFEKLPETIRRKCKIIMLSTSESFKDLNRANKNIYVYKFLNKPLGEAMLNAINI